MTDIVLFHHAQGQTPGFLAFADDWRRAGHTVHTPDLYDGATFRTLDEGVAHAESVGFGEIVRRGTAAVATLPTALVYAGMSLGALPAQALTQTRPGAVGAVLLHGGVPTGTFGAPWPADTPVQVHAMQDDDWAEVPVLQALTAEIAQAELFLYPGAAHLFTDSGLDDHDEQAALLVRQRTSAFLDRLAAPRGT